MKAITFCILALVLAGTAAGEDYQPRTYTDHPVAVERSSWGSVKTLYRGVH